MAPGGELTWPPTPILLIYLKTPTSILNITPEAINSLLSFAEAFILILLTIVLISSLWISNGRPLLRAAFAGAMIILAIWLSGDMVYLLSIIKIIPINGFETFGIFSIAVLITIGAVFIFQLAKQIVPKSS